MTRLEHPRSVPLTDPLSSLSQLPFPSRLLLPIFPSFLSSRLTPVMMHYHSCIRRLGVVAILSAFLLLLLCAAASISGIIFDSPSSPVQAHAEVVRINRFRKRLNGNDEVSLNLNISADLRSLFSWNTKQVFVIVTAEYQTLQNSVNQVTLWDQVIRDKDHANFQILAKNKYLLIDQGSHLLGKEIELVLHWHAMHMAGLMSRDNMTLSNFKLPEVYKL